MNPKIEALINQLEELKNKSDSEACKNLFGTVIEVLKNEPTNDEILEELLSYFWKEGDKINQICPDYYTSFLKILGNLSELFSDDKLKYFHLGVSWYRSGKIHKEKGNLDDAMNCFKNAIRYYENTVNIDSNLANAWYNLGLSWAKSGKIHKEKGNLDDAMNCFKNAIRYYENTVKINPNFADAWYNLGLSWARSGEIHKEKGNLDDAMNCFKNAIRYCKNAVKINPNLANAWSNLGFSWAKSGEIRKEKGNLDDAMNCFKNAIRYCENAVKINPNLANAWYNLGVSWQKLGEIHKEKGNIFDNSIRCLENAVKINPNFADAWYNLGVSWARSGEIHKEKGNLDDAMNCFKNAIRYCENAVNIDPNLANAWSDLGILWRMLIKIIPIKPLLNTAISYELTILFNLKRIIDGLNSKLLIESYINKFVFSSLDRLLFYSSLHKNSLTEKKEILEAVEQFKGYFFFKEFVGKQQITDNTNLNKLLKLHEKFNVNKTIENALHSLKNAMQKDNSIDTNLLRYIILESEAENSTNNKEKTREIEQIFYDTLKNISVNFNFDNLNLKTNETIVYLLFREIAIYRDIKRVLTIILVYKNGGEIKVNTKNYDIGGTNIDDYAEISYLLNAKLILPLASNKNLDDNLLKDIKNKIERGG